MTSGVVKLSYPDPQIAVIMMEEREHRNTFSKELINGMIDAFKTIQENNVVKVVIIHGYENYFCCGGTKEELLNIYHGKVTFADLSFYRLLLDCEVPTIAAMQGHAIGGGLAFGCYADFLILAEESLYSANFMKYGFTPGMGATYMLPQKFGAMLGNEMLFSAKNYRGITLKERGAPCEVVKKVKVIEIAMELAKELIEKPRLSLKTLKTRLTKEIKMHLPEVIKEELEMHQTTFAQFEVKQRIESLFGS